MSEVVRVHYSSGTTGTPKGIMLPFKSWLNLSRNLLLDQMPYLDFRDPV